MSTAVSVKYMDATRGFKLLLSSELYNDITKVGYVPNPNDLIVDYDANMFYRCTATDYTAITWTLVAWRPTPVFNSENSIGSCSQTLADSCRVLIDTSVHPATLRIDSRLTFKGPDMDSIKVFRGTDIGVNGEVISVYYKDGAVVSESIPMVLAAGSDTVAIKAPVRANAKGTFNQSERCTIVCYDEAGVVSAIAYAYIVLTNLVAASDTAVKQILDIRLVSPWLTPGDDSVLGLPINIPLEDISLSAKVIYNDGYRTVPVDGTRCWLNGLRSAGAADTKYISSILGDKLPLTLFYAMADDEEYFGDNVSNKTIYRPYTATTTAVQGAYSVKLFVVPRWIDSANGYRLSYYLYDITRGNVFDATAYVLPAINGGVFDPTLYGVKQHLAVIVDMSKVSSMYVGHQHAQSFAITLLAAATDYVDNYRIEYVHNNPDYGTGVRAEFVYTNNTYWTLDVSCGQATQAEWLAKLYTLCYPLYDSRSETAAPLPSHFEVVTKDKTYLRSVDQWAEPFNVNFQINEGDAIQIRWIRKTPNDDLQLGLSPMIAHQKL